MFTLEKFDSMHLIVFCLMAVLGAMHVVSASLMVLVVYLLETGRHREFSLFKFPVGQRIKMYVSLLGIGVGSVVSVLVRNYIA